MHDVLFAKGGSGFLFFAKKNCVVRLVGRIPIITRDFPSTDRTEEEETIAELEYLSPARMIFVIGKIDLFKETSLLRVTFQC